MPKNLNDYNPNPNLRQYRKRLKEAGDDWKRVQKDLVHQHQHDKAALMLIWRTRNIDLFDYEAAEVLQRSPHYVRMYTRSQMYIMPTARTRKTASTVYDGIVTRVCLDHFDDTKWLHNSLTSVGMRALSVAANKPTETMYDVIEALGNPIINPVDIQIYHRIYQLYIVQGRTVAEVAEILRTSISYINDCLAKYRLPTSVSKLVNYDPSVLRLFRQIRYYTPDVIRLQKGGIVVSGSYNISITMSQQVKKRQSTRLRIDDKVHDYQWLPKIVPDYPDQTVDDYPHWTAKMEINNAIEKRVAALRLLNYAVKCKGKWPTHQPNVLNIALTQVMTAMSLKADYWWTIVEHYFGNEELQFYAERPTQMLHILTDATSGDYVRFNKIITSRSITEYLYRQRLRIGYLNPTMLLWTLKTANVVGPIYDPYPGIGCLAVACKRAGIEYYYGSDDHIFNRGVANGFVEAIGGGCFPYDDRPVNYLMSQNLPVSWYPLYGKNARMWSMINGGNVYHLKLALQQYKIHKTYSMHNSLRMVNFLPHESTKYAISSTG